MTAREIVERLPMFVVACSHCPKPLSHDYGYAEKANLALAIVTAALDAAVRAERERCARIVEGHAPRTREESQDGTLGTISLVLHAAADALRTPEASP